MALNLNHFNVVVLNFTDDLVNFFLSGDERTVTNLNVCWPWGRWLVFNFAITKDFSLIDILIDEYLLARVHFSTMDPRNLRDELLIMIFGEILDHLFFGSVKGLILAKSQNHSVREIFHEQRLLDRMMLIRCIWIQVLIFLILRDEREHLRNAELFENLSYLLPIVNIDENNIDVDRLAIFRNQLVVKLEAVKPNKLTIFTLDAKIAFIVVYRRRNFKNSAPVVSQII